MKDKKVALILLIILVLILIGVIVFAILSSSNSGEKVSPTVTGNVIEFQEDYEEPISIPTETIYLVRSIAESVLK